MRDNGFNTKRSSSKKITELFIRVEERLNTRKALEKDNVCTLEKYMGLRYLQDSDKK